MNNYNQIEVIDQDNVRYIGSLSDINSKEAKLSLKNLTVYGTENRKAEIFVPFSYE